MLRIGTIRNFAHGDLVIRRGDSLLGVYLIMSGRLRVATMTEDGDEQFFKWLTPGELIGVSAVLNGCGFSSNVFAVGPTEIVWVPRDAMLRLLRSDPETTLAVLSLLCRRVDQLMDMVTDQAMSGLDQRIWAALERLARYHGIKTPEGIRLDITQDDIAQAVSASRQSVSVQLRKLRDQGRIQLGYRYLVITPEGARQMSPPNHADPASAAV